MAFLSTDKNSQSSIAIRNANVVTENALLTGTSVYISEGVIQDIRSDDIPWHGKTIDGRHKYLFPGFIDLHSDAIEKEIEPRPNVLFPLDYAIFELDKKLASCGITTIYHSLSFAELEVGLRSNGMAAHIIRTIHSLRNMLTVNTKVHARYEMTDCDAVAILAQLIKEQKIQLMSLMDHTPGQGQFREITSYKEYFGRVYKKTDAELNTIIERKLQARHNGAAQALAFLISLCKEHHVTLASHDDDSPEKIQLLLHEGVSISEFPVTLEAARYARKHGIHVCVGAPNILRGNSQLRNLSAREAIFHGVGNIICSDYAPSSILHSIFTLVNLGICNLVHAVRMCSLNPALAVGIANTTGSIAVGKDADLVLVDVSLGIPRIVKTFVKGKEVFSTCAS